jgi:nitroreductase
LSAVEAFCTAPAPADWAAALIHGRRTILPKRLGDPGPDATQLRVILEAAAAAPDHAELLPWRFVMIPTARRELLAEVFAAALRDRDSAAPEALLAQARAKAYRAPTLMLAIAKLWGEGSEVPDLERVVSAGCAIQNMLLMATALGFGSSLTSGKALASRALRELFDLASNEQPLCFIGIGTVLDEKRTRPRPPVERFFAELAGGIQD